MHVCGIIAEYNPFHSGHAYQIAQAREKSGCDFCVVVMSGDFVQRGAPALADKYIRTRQALAGGADLVLMLPVYGSTASAEGFARTGVAALGTTGIIDTISFGCEEPSICSDSYRSLARELNTEHAAFRELLAARLSDGRTYAQARTDAIQSFFGTHFDLSLLEQPNNLLAFEYIRALEFFDKNMRLCPIRRLGSYHDEAVPTASHMPTSDVSASAAHHAFASASACRRALLSDHDLALQTLMTNGQLLARSGSILADYAKEYPFLQENDMSQMLHYALLTQTAEGFEQIQDCGSDLSARILRQLDSYENFSQFCDILKNKSVTYARISRVLTHILLQLPAQLPTPLVSADGTIPYLRVLGFREAAVPLLHAMKKQSPVPIITRAAEAAKVLSPEALRYFKQDLLASELYRSMILQKCGHCYPDDYRRKIEIFS